MEQFTTEHEAQKTACLALHLAGQSNKSIFKKISNIESLDFLQTGYTLFGEEFDQLLKDAVETMISHKNRDIQVMTVVDKNYPFLLRKSAGPPLALFYIGESQLLTNPLISIVGTREPSMLTIQWIKYVCEFLSTEGFTLVSGLALGIDSIVHANSYASGTIGVSPQSLDLVSPKLNDYLYKSALRRKHPVLIVSEYPVSTHVRKYHYIHRNRIISGISENVIFAEGSKDSGAMITAKWHIKNGRKLYALYSPLQKNNSGGLHLLNTDQANNISNFFPIDIYDKPYEEADKTFLLNKPVYLGNGKWAVINTKNFSIKFLSPGLQDRDSE